MLNVSDVLTETQVADVQADALPPASAAPAETAPSITFEEVAALNAFSPMAVNVPRAVDAHDIRFNALTMTDIYHAQRLLDMGLFQQTQGSLTIFAFTSSYADRCNALRHFHEARPSVLAAIMADAR